MASSGRPQLRMERRPLPERIPIPCLSGRIPMLQDTRAGCGLVQTERLLDGFREPRLRSCFCPITTCLLPSQS